MVEKMIRDECIFCVHIHKREKVNNIEITNRLIIANSGGVKQQRRVVNEPFDL